MRNVTILTTCIFLISYSRCYSQQLQEIIKDEQRLIQLENSIQCYSGVNDYKSSARKNKKSSKQFIVVKDSNGGVYYSSRKKLDGSKTIYAKNEVYSFVVQSPDEQAWKLTSSSYQEKLQPEQLFDQFFMIHPITDNIIQQPMSVILSNVEPGAIAIENNRLTVRVKHRSMHQLARRELTFDGTLTFEKVVDIWMNVGASLKVLEIPSEIIFQRKFSVVNNRISQIDITNVGKAFGITTEDSLSIIPQSPSQIPDEQLRLTYYGLPEPEGVVWERPRPLWHWLLCGVILCAVLSILFRVWAKRARQKTVTPSTAE